MGDKQKLLVIAGYKFIPATDGGKKAIYFFESYLAEYFDIEIISTPDNGITGNEHFELNGLLGRSGLRYVNFFLFFKLLRKVKKEQYKLLLLEQVYFGWLGLLLKLFGGLKLVIHHHNIEGLRFRSLKKWWWPIMWMYERLVCRFADVNFFITAADEAYAIKNYGIDREKSLVTPYGVVVEESPSAEERDICKEVLLKEYNLPAGTFLMLFAASYNYKPNFDALKRIIENINPLLLTTNLNYRIIICGGGLPKEMGKLEAYKTLNIIYAGFVDDIDLYFKGTDLFLNPVTDGGGIKTKIVEALALGTSVVSMESGAIGVDAAICGGKLNIVPDNDDERFSGIVMNKIKVGDNISTPKIFYDFFSWRRVADKAQKNLLLVFESKNV